MESSGDAWAGFEQKAAAGAPPDELRLTCAGSGLDQLLNDLQGNALLVDDDRGLARFGEPRLLAIREAALAEAMAAAAAEQAWAVLTRDAGSYAGTWVEHSVLAHLRRLREQGLRWRRLADHAALYLRDRALARDRVGAWLAESRIKDEWPGR